MTDHFDVIIVGSGAGVVDTSFFPSIGAVNPALTAIANAMRVGEHITQRIAT